METFENADSSYSCGRGRAKTEVFKYDDVMHRFRLALPHIRNATCARAQIFLNTEKKPPFSKIPVATCRRSNTIQKRYLWTQVFFKYGGKNLRFRKYPAKCGRGLKWQRGTKTVEHQVCDEMEQVHICVPLSFPLSFSSLGSHLWDKHKHKNLNKRKDKGIPSVFFPQNHSRIEQTTPRNYFIRISRFF